MPTLEELLRASLKGADEKINKANSDLHAAVVDAAKAVEAVTGGKATLRLRGRGGDTFDGNRLKYELGLVDRLGKEFRALASLNVSVSGYPITAFDQSGKTWDSREINSPEELSAFFQKLASDPDSFLVAHLAYINRNPSEDE
jgi:hypothetical protein